MKKIVFFLFICCGFIVKAQIVNIPDANFKAVLLAANPSNLIATNLSNNYFKIDSNNDGEIQLIEAQNVKSLNIASIGILSLEGVLSFSNMRSLNCAGNSLTSINLQNLSSLTYLDFSNNNVQSANLTGLFFLTNLYCSSNQLIALDIATHFNLNFLNCNNNLLTSLNTSTSPNINELSCSNNLITQLILTNNSNLQSIVCNNNQLESINLTGLFNLSSINCSFNQLTTLDFSNTNVSFDQIVCSNNQLNSIIFPSAVINYFDCSNNQLNSIILPNAVINYFNCSNNLLSSLEFLTDSTSCIPTLNCSFNQIQSLNFGNNCGVFDLTCNNNQLTELIIKDGNTPTYLNFSSNPNLNFICCDESELNLVTNLVSNYGYTNCVITSNCPTLDDVTFTNELSILLHPNPVSEILTISINNGSIVDGITIYNSMGQLVMEINNANETNSVDVSQLTSGTYFIKVISDKGSSNSKFIKG